jgi:glycopeptide antibiotics resistance protein
MINASILILAIPLYIIVRVLRIKVSKQNAKWLTEITFLMFFCYLLILVGVTVFPMMIDKMYVPFGLARIKANMVPVIGIIDEIKLLNGNQLEGLYFILKTIGPSLILLLPFGLFFPILFNDKKELYYRFYIGLVLTLMLEFTQFIQTAYGYNISRVLDINDIILNVIGFIIGYTISQKLIEMNKIGRLITKYDLTIREIDSEDESA